LVLDIYTGDYKNGLSQKFLKKLILSFILCYIDKMEISQNEKESIEIFDLDIMQIINNRLLN